MQKLLKSCIKWKNEGTGDITSLEKTRYIVDSDSSIRQSWRTVKRLPLFCMVLEVRSRVKEK